MRRIVVPILLLASTVCCAPTAAAQGAFAASHSALRRALCRERPCSVEWVLPAGIRERGARLAVVRLREGPVRCMADAPERGYRDWLVSERRGRVRRERELVRGDTPCLEWELSSWRFENGELIFRHGGLGAPPSSETDRRPVQVRFTPWPLAITATYRGDERVVSTAVLPSSGPAFILSME